MSDPFGHWLAGFTDGEGSFEITVQRNRNALKCRYAITLRADEEPILRDIQQFVGHGNIYWQDRTSNAAHPNPGVRFETASRQGSARLVEIFNQYPLRAKKRADFDIWAQAVAAWADHDWETMLDLRRSLQQGRKFQAAPAPLVPVVAVPAQLKMVIR